MANTLVLSPLITTNVAILKPNIDTAKMKNNTVIEAGDKYLSSTFGITTLVGFRISPSAP